MATNWTTQNKASSTDNFTVETKTKASTTDNWEIWGIGSISIGPKWEAVSDDWEDLTDHYWEWTKIWTFSGKATTRDSD